MAMKKIVEASIAFLREKWRQNEKGFMCGSRLVSQNHSAVCAIDDGKA